MTFRNCIAILLILAASTAAAWAQTSGTISGVIRDDSGAVVAGAKVLAISANTGERREATTATTGQYTFPFLAPGSYRIEASLTGFGTSIGTAVLGVTERLGLDLTLQPASVAESVNVTSTAPLLQTESAAT